MKKQQKYKDNKGITLVVLVVTIVILLILVGVSVNLVVGDNGLIEKSKEIEKETEETGLKEKIKLKMLEFEKEDIEDLGEYLNKIDGVIVEKVAEGTYYVTRENMEVTVYEDGKVLNGKVEIWDGKSMESPEYKEFNWYIYTPSQLKFLADYVNNGLKLTSEQETMLTQAGYNPADVTMTEETIVYLMNDLDLGARELNGEWETEANEAVQWTAIGKKTGNTLLATFEGNGNTIRGVYIKTDTSVNGVFGNSNSIKNLTIKNSYIKGASGTAGIVGVIRKGTVENCHNINTTVTSIEGVYYTVGGVVGQASDNTSVLSCSNTGKIVGNAISSNEFTQGGGVVGCAQNSTTIADCYNTGTILGNAGAIGGIVGLGGETTTIINCYNTGMVTGNKRGIGGVAGIINSYSTISNSYNTGIVTGETETGGVVGIAYQSSIIENCYNIGAITGNAEMVGGIAGYSATSSIINNCYNTGNIIGKNDYVGGIIGKVNPSTTISSCYNTGAITSEGTWVGGIVAVLFMNGNVINCYNTGDVIGKTNYVGGIVGTMANQENVTNSKVENCYNSGKISGVNYTGGIVGIAEGSNGQGTIIKCYNKGEVIGSEYVGAVIGTQINTTGLNILNNLYYQKILGIGAINGEDDETNNIMATTENIPSYEQFLEWIQNK